MKCPHCAVEVHVVWNDDYIRENDQTIIGYKYRASICPSPACAHPIIELGLLDNEFDVEQWQTVVPRGVTRGPVPAEVPSTISVDYLEACEVLSISPKASAALSRRCLQNMLHAHGYTGRDLAREIDMLLNEADPRKALPETLRVTVDGIRNFGNFSAHPITDVTSTQIIDVEPYEAEWCLEVLEECFQHFYVRPAAALARKATLDAKLANGENQLPKGK